MRTLFVMIILILIVGLNGCGGDIPSGKISSNEYHYLSDFVKKDSKWGNSEYKDFIHALNEKHIVELAYASGVGDINDNSIISDSKNRNCSRACNCQSLSYA